MLCLACFLSTMGLFAFGI